MVDRASVLVAVAGAGAGSLRVVLVGCLKTALERPQGLSRVVCPPDRRRGRSCLILASPDRLLAAIAVAQPGIRSYRELETRVDRGGLVTASTGP